MVAYIGGARRSISPRRVLEILRGCLGISEEHVSVHPYRPEDFLVVFASAEIRNRVTACPSVEFQGDRLHFRPWNRQSQAVHAVLGFKVRIVIEGIPPHAWERETAKELLGSSCEVDAIAPETSSRSDLSAFRLTAWTATPEEIPSLHWLAVPEPGTEMPPPLLQYKVLIHVDAVADFRDAGEPMFFAGSSDGQSGIPDSDDDLGGEGGVGRPRRLGWQFGVRDSRRGGDGRSLAGAGGSSREADRSHSVLGWKLPPMGPVPVITRTRPQDQVWDRVATRPSAFDRLNGRQPLRDHGDAEIQRSSNPLGANQVDQVQDVDRLPVGQAVIMDK
ncbi:hypothetical protein VPH35_136739 [Triticum aestivum]